MLRWVLNDASAMGYAFRENPFILFIYFLFKIYLQLTVNKKKYLAYLKTMLIYVKKNSKNINISWETVTSISALKFHLQVNKMLKIVFAKFTWAVFRSSAFYLTLKIWSNVDSFISRGILFQILGPTKEAVSIRYLTVRTFLNLKYAVSFLRE